MVVRENVPAVGGMGVGPITTEAIEPSKVMMDWPARIVQVKGDNILGGHSHCRYNFFTCQFRFDLKPIPVEEREITGGKYRIVANELNNRKEPVSEVLGRGGR